MNKSNRINGREALSRIAYYNCLMLAPDGTKLGYCDEKKERYYLSHGLISAFSQDVTATWDMDSIKDLL